MQSLPAIQLLSTALLASLLAGCAANKSLLQSAPPQPGGPIVLRTAAATQADPLTAGRTAAAALRQALGAVRPHAVVMVDSYDTLARKQAALNGVASVFPREILFGGATYGMFTQAGSHDLDGVALLALGGEGLAVTAALSERMGATGLTLETNGAELAQALGAGGERLARCLPGLERGALLLLMADAHSPKNQLLIDGVQRVAGKRLPITGGSVNKNAGQTYVYFRGQTYTDSAIGLLLTGDFKVAQTGLQAKSNEAVIATARDGAAAALEKLHAKPFAVLAYNCGGRLGKLNRLEDELEAIQSAIGRDVPLFGCYCAGEFGPADEAGADDATSTGRGWHVMFSALGQ